MICYIKINSDVAQSKKFKSIKELSDIGQELNGNGPNVFFNISSINLVANTLGYIQTNNQFGIMPKNKNYLPAASIILMSMKKVLKMPQLIHLMSIFSRAVLRLKTRLITIHIM